MKNILYYLKKYGKYTLEEKPFNDVDSLIFSSLSYLMFDGLIPDLKEKKKPVPIRKLKSEFVLNRLIVNTMDPGPNKKLWRLLLTCPRFCDMELGYYRAIADHGIVEQFAAITCFLPDGKAYVCFRGTDLTLLGWKENFKMSYLEEIPAQADAVAYLNAVAARTKGGLYVGGHSKGGNLAVYAAMNCRDAVRKRIIGVFNHDGPGFLQDVYHTEKYLAVADRVQKLIPWNDLVGMLLHHDDKLKIVKCRGILILQHDPYNWVLKRDGTFKSVSTKSSSSDFFDVTSKAWLNSLEEKRPHFVDLLFHILGADDGVTLVDYRVRPVEELRAAKGRYRDLEDEERHFFKESLKQFVRYGKENMRRIKKRVRKGKKTAKKAAATEEEAAEKE